MQNKKKFIIFTLSAGHGHLSTARKIKEYCEAHQGISVEVYDVVSHLPLKYRAGVSLYNFIQKFYPILWNQLKKVFYLFSVKGEAKQKKSYGGTLRSFILAILIEKKPDLVIINNGWIVNRCASIVKELSQVPVAVLVTDPFDGFASGWADSTPDHIVVPTKKCAEVIMGMNPLVTSKIQLAPYPVDRPRKKKNHPWKKSIIVLAGSMGHVKYIEYLRTVMTMKCDALDIHFVSGSNKRLFRLANKLALSVRTRHRVHVHGFVHAMNKLYEQSSIIISKPGPMTMYEALYAGLFVLIPSKPIMSQERFFMEKIIEHGYGASFSTSCELENAVQKGLTIRFSDDSEFFREIMSRNPMKECISLFRSLANC